MRLRLEQSLREGKFIVAFTTVMLPLWLMSASVHRGHWNTGLATEAWSSFLLDWSALLWSGFVASIIAVWLPITQFEPGSRLVQMWTRCCCGLIALALAFLCALPSWNWAGQLVGEPFVDVLLYAFTSLFAPLVAILIGSIVSAFTLDFIAIVLTLASSWGVVGIFWAELYS